MKRETAMLSLLLHLKMPRIWGVSVMMSCEGEGHLSQDSLLKGIKEPSHIKTRRCYWWSQNIVMKLIAKVMVWLKTVFRCRAPEELCSLPNVLQLSLGWLTDHQIFWSEWVNVCASYTRKCRHSFERKTWKQTKAQLHRLAATFGANECECFWCDRLTRKQITASAIFVAMMQLVKTWSANFFSALD